MCMPKNLRNWINEMQENLKQKGYTKDIPLGLFYDEFMIISGYNRKKVIEWVNNFHLVKLIQIEDDKVNFP